MATTTETLTERDREILLLERSWFRYAGVKEQLVREKFGITMTRYYQELNALLEREDALAFDPILVKRLRNVRASRKI